MNRRGSTYFNFIKKTEGNSLVENVIVLPLIFLCIYFIIIGAFFVHDKITLDAAVERGAVYAAKCVSDPNYAEIAATIYNDEDGYTMEIKGASGASFTGVGKDIHPYRYVMFTYKGQIEQLVRDHTYEAVKNTKIPWRELTPESVTCKIDNYVVYQEVTVTAKASYPIPKLFALIGLPTEIEYTASATESVTDPDELIRNADLIVDTIVKVDNMTGNHLKKITDALERFTAQIKNSTFARFINLK
ncbi:MAG: pilus assembly protein [Lachnospiraceae bacterium]|nr:pilus assembly protein [Lachnospiraceae bacterium]